jgi:hypothetical protein
MKKLLIMFLAIIFTVGAVDAQVTKVGQKKQGNKNMACYVMKDGKMYHCMAGKETLMEKEVTLKNGEKIMPNGTCKMKDGKEMTLKNDECVDLNGKFHKSHEGHHKKS